VESALWQLVFHNKNPNADLANHADLTSALQPSAEFAEPASWPLVLKTKAERRSRQSRGSDLGVATIHAIRGTRAMAVGVNNESRTPISPISRI
jgi:hypothetical protein